VLHLIVVQVQDRDVGSSVEVGHVRDVVEGEQD